MNHVKQLATACMLFETNHKSFPSGGWGYKWMGDPDLPPGGSQPGGWTYHILPFIEQGSVHDLPKGRTGQDKIDATLEMANIPLELFNCPSRRRSIIYPYVHKAVYFNAPGLTSCSRGDYSANLGDAGDGTGGVSYDSGPTELTGDIPDNWPWKQLNHNGVIYQRSIVRSQALKDGASTTYLLGERALNPENYETGLAIGDDKCLLAGYDDDNVSSTHLQTPPLRDTSGIKGKWQFGSAHPSSFLMAFCDGSVRAIRYTIDPEMHRRLGNREDNLPVPANAYD